MGVIEINCSEVVQEISNYIDNDVQAELRGQLESHFQGCAHCKAILDGTKNVVKLVANGVELELPKEFSKRLYDKVRKA